MHAGKGSGERRRREKSIFFSGIDDFHGVPCGNRKYCGYCDSNRCRRTGSGVLDVADGSDRWGVCLCRKYVGADLQD